MGFLQHHGFEDTLVVEAFDVTLPEKAGNPFDVSPAAMNYVLNAAENLVREKKNELDHLAELLTNP